LSPHFVRPARVQRVRRRVLLSQALLEPPNRSRHHFNAAVFI
jgi:hypothetical protein